MDRKIGLKVYTGHVYQPLVVQRAAGTQFMLDLRTEDGCRLNPALPYVESAMFDRIVELEDRLGLADRQYAGVVLALMAGAGAGKVVTTPVSRAHAYEAIRCVECGQQTIAARPVCSLCEADKCMSTAPQAEPKPEYEHHADGKVSFVNYEALSQASIRAQDRHDRALADALWIFKKEAGLIGFDGPKMAHALGEALKAYNQHGVAK
jgi:hypothetical protein